MNKEQLNKIYNILIKYAGTYPRMRDTFIQNHITERPCKEWRFGGKLGFGGKYWSEDNKVSCYPEDKTESMTILINNINSELNKITNAYSAKI